MLPQQLQRSPLHLVSLRTPQMGRALFSPDSKTPELLNADGDVKCVISLRRCFPLINVHEKNTTRAGLRPQVCRPAHSYFTHHPSFFMRLLHFCRHCDSTSTCAARPHENRCKKTNDNPRPFSKTRDVRSVRSCDPTFPPCVL